MRYANERCPGCHKDGCNKLVAQKVSQMHETVCIPLKQAVHVFQSRTESDSGEMPRYLSGTPRGGGGGGEGARKVVLLAYLVL